MKSFRGITAWLSVAAWVLAGAVSGLAAEPAAASRATVSPWLGHPKWKGTWTLDISGKGSATEMHGFQVQYDVTASSSGSFTLDEVEVHSSPSNTWGRYESQEPVVGTGAYTGDETETMNANEYSVYHWDLGASPVATPGKASMVIYPKTNDYIFLAPFLFYIGNMQYTDYSNGAVTNSGTLHPPMHLWTNDPSTDPTMATHHWPLPAQGEKLTQTVNFQTRIYELAADYENILDKPALNATLTWTVEPDETVTIEITKLAQKKSTGNMMLFMKSKLALSAEAKVTPEKFVKDVEWDVSSIGAVAPVVKTKSGKGGIAKVDITYAIPALNSQFGAYSLRARVKDRTEWKTKAFQVYFQRDAKDNPGKKTPNWYYYWSQDAVPDLGQFTYDDKGGNGYVLNKDKVMALTVNSKAVNAIAAADVSLSDSSGAHTYHLQRDGADGIKAVAALVAHALKQRDLFEHATGDDADVDGVSDSAEQPGGLALWTSPASANTYSLTAAPLYPPDYLTAVKGKELKTRKAEVAAEQALLDKSGDNELRALAAEKDRVCVPTKDFAVPGSQSGP